MEGLLKVYFLTAKIALLKSMCTFRIRAQMVHTAVYHSPVNVARNRLRCLGGRLRGGGGVELRRKNYSYFPTGSRCIIVFTQCNVMESDVTLRFLHLKAKGTERMQEIPYKPSEFSMVNEFRRW